MANGYFERGEVYWVRMDNGFGGEQGVGRPGLILTENGVNAKCSTVTIAFMSTKHHPSNPFYLPVEATGITSYVVLNQIMTYDKTRIGKYMGMLNSAEQKAVDDALEDLFDLGYVDETALKEKENEIAGLNLMISEAKADAAGAKAEIEKRDGEIAALKMEIEMWQKCYGRCMDMLVDMKVAGDVSRRVMVPAAKALLEQPPKPVVEPREQPEPPKQPDPPVEEPEQEKRLDINSCTATALKKIGFSLALARKIVESRPFKSVEDLKRVNGLKGSQYRIMEPKLCCVAVKVEAPPKVEEPVVTEEPAAVETRKVNVNTATAKEINAVSGLNLATAYSICGYRKKNGPYEKLEDLLKVTNVYPGTLQRYGEYLEV